MQKRYSVPAFLRLYGKWGLLALIPLLLFSLWNLGDALATAPHGYRQIALVPDALQCFDIGYLTQDDYYLANSTQKRIDHIDLAKNRPGQLHIQPMAAGDFTGNGGCLSYDYSQMGPAGVLMDTRHQLWAANGNSSLLIFSPDHHHVTHLSTGGTRRADEMALDARRGVLVVANPDESVPFLSFIDTHTHKIISKLSFPGATGLEQSVWIRGMDDHNDRFYLSVPGTVSHPNGEIAVIDAASRTLIGSYPLSTPCNPTGLAVGEHDTILAVGCDTGNDSLLLKLGTGITRPVVGAGGTDIVGYDPSTHRYSFASVQHTSVVVADERGQVTQVIPTAPGAHSVTVGHGWLLIPEADRGIAVFSYC